MLKIYIHFKCEDKRLYCWLKKEKEERNKKIDIERKRGSSLPLIVKEKKELCFNFKTS